MPPSFLSLVLESSRFRNEVSALIVQQIMGRQCTGYPGGAATPGIIVAYELNAPLVFGPPEGSGLQFDLDFESRGVASGHCKTSDGEDYTYSKDGPVLGRIFIGLGPDSLIEGSLEEIIKGTIPEITFTDLQIDDQSPTDGPPEKFAGES